MIAVFETEEGILEQEVSSTDEAEEIARDNGYQIAFVYNA